jgi:TonB family protein
MIALIGEAAARSLALGVVVWLAMRLLRPRNPHLHKTVWITVLLASIAMPFVLKWGVAPRVDLATFTALVQSEGPAAHTAAAHSGLGAQAFMESLPMGAITAVYALVALALLARFAVGLLGISRLRRVAEPFAGRSKGSFDIRVSSKILSPATFGSTILLPASSAEWSEQKLTAVLSHECSHVKNRDCYMQWLARLHACIFWFNPLAWWLQRRLAELAETTSDDAVIAATADRTGYADVLLEIARHPTPGRVVMSAAQPNISARIDRIISNTPPASPPRRWVRALAVAVLIPPFIMAAANTSPAGHEGNAKPALPERFKPEPPNPDPLAPKVIQFGELANLSAVYPIEAKRLGREGIVVISSMIDADGRVLDATVIDEYPTDVDYGFGAAARNVAYTMRFSNPRGEVTRVKFRVKFELSDKPREPAAPSR